MDDFRKFDLDRIDQSITKKDINSESTKYDNVVSVWAWVLLSTIISMLSILPLGGFIGIIIYIILSVVDINQNIKNFSRGMLILIIIGLLFSLIFLRISFDEIISYMLRGLF